MGTGGSDQSMEGYIHRFATANAQYENGQFGFSDVEIPQMRPRFSCCYSFLVFQSHGLGFSMQMCLVSMQERSIVAITRSVAVPSTVFSRPTLPFTQVPSSFCLATMLKGRVSSTSIRGSSHRTRTLRRGRWRRKVAHDAKG
jgi:hypothetical protein